MGNTQASDQFSCTSGFKQKNPSNHHFQTVHDLYAILVTHNTDQIDNQSFAQCWDQHDYLAHNSSIYCYKMTFLKNFNTTKNILLSYSTEYN